MWEEILVEADGHEEHYTFEGFLMERDYIYKDVYDLGELGTFDIFEDSDGLEYALIGVEHFNTTIYNATLLSICDMNDLREYLLEEKSEKAFEEYQDDLVGEVMTIRELWDDNYLDSELYSCNVRFGSEDEDEDDEDDPNYDAYYSDLANCILRDELCILNDNVEANFEIVTENKKYPARTVIKITSIWH